MRVAKEKSPLSRALKKSVDIIAPVIDEGTVLRINVFIDNGHGEGLSKYTYIALFVNNRWYMTGIGSLLEREYTTISHLLAAVSKYPGSTIELATEFDSIR